MWKTSKEVTYACEHPGWCADSGSCRVDSLGGDELSSQHGPTKGRCACRSDRNRSATEFEENTLIRRYVFFTDYLNFKREVAARGKGWTDPNKGSSEHE